MVEIPIDVYVVEVQESNDYQAESFVIDNISYFKLLNMFELSENN